MAKRKPKKTAFDLIKEGLEQGIDALRTGKKLRTTTLRRVVNPKDGTEIITRVKNYSDDEEPGRGKK